MLSRRRKNEISFVGMFMLRAVGLKLSNNFAWWFTQHNFLNQGSPVVTKMRHDKYDCSENKYQNDTG